MVPYSGAGAKPGSGMESHVSNPTIEQSKKKKRRCSEDIRSSDHPLKSRHDLLISAHSQSKPAKIKLARRLVEKYSKLKGREDPLKVSADSSTFVLNLLADYRRFGTPNSFKKDSMSAIT